MGLKNITIKKALPYMYIVGGTIGLAASFILSQDTIKSLQNPGFQADCNLNPVISCGSVMKSTQGTVFGFPNPWIGLAAFAAVVTIGIVLLAGTNFKRWFWQLMYGGLLVGFGFALWLLYQSVYHINALCPFCLTVDAVMITMVWYTTLFLIQAKVIKPPKSWRKYVDFAQRHHLDVLVFLVVIITALVLKHFWYYYGQHL